MIKIDITHNEKSISKGRKFIAGMVSGIVPCRMIRNRVRNIIKFGIFSAARTIVAGGGVKNKYFLTVSAVARNEGRYFKEWIDYHRLVGVEKFYIFDNESTDNTFEILKPYIDAGVVEYHYVRGEGVQNRVNYAAVRRAAAEAHWLAVIDLDEFIMPVKDCTIPDFLRRIPQRTAQIFIRWCLYGSAGHVIRPAGLVIENYKYRQRDNSGEANKIIVNPRMVVGCRSPHVFDVIWRSVDERGHAVTPSNVIPGLSQDIIRINHYRCKSWQDSQEKHTKGDAFWGSGYVRYTRADFDKFDTNDVYDNSMDKYARLLKKEDDDGQ